MPEASPETPVWRKGLIWLALVLALSTPLWLAAYSPLLAWRDPTYIIAGFAGIAAMALMLVQPLLIRGAIPDFGGAHARRTHFWLGLGILALIVLHVAGLWLTSPPDVVDVLLFRSPTPFSIWGVLAMWALFAAALLAVLRKRLRLRPQVWRLGHTGLVSTIVVGSVVHSLLIEGTMEMVSKVVLCALVVFVTAQVIWARKVWIRHRKGS
jgi:predicted ferric reductase